MFLIPFILNETEVQTTMASKERRAQKPKIEITLQRSANFEEVRAKKQAIVRYTIMMT